MKQRSGNGKRVARRSVAYRVRTRAANVLLWMIIIVLAALCLAALVLVALRYYRAISQH